MKRRRVLGVFFASALMPAAARAQKSDRVHRIGFFGTAFASGYVRELEWIRAGLRRFGYAEGANLLIEYRWAEGSDERIRKIAAEFAALPLDAILAHGLPGAVAAARATSTIPIVMADGGDPVAAGVADSLARPGRNVTGSTSFVPEESVKRLELLKELLPRLKRVAVLVSSQPPPVYPATRKALEAAAGAIQVELSHFAMREAEALPGVFDAMRSAGMEAVLVNNEPSLNSHVSAIGALAAARRLPAAGYPSLADSGGLIAYGANRAALYERAGYFLDRIFRGAKPGEIPIERATKFDFLVNLKTAKAMGIPVPQTVLARADRVIE